MNDCKAFAVVALCGFAPCNLLAEEIYTQVNRDYVIKYSDCVRNRPQLKGVMSPSRPMTESDFLTLQEWGATFLRYQMGGCPKAEVGNPVLYDAWLMGKLDHLETLVIPMCRKYGLMVCVDLHCTPGLDIKGTNGTEKAIFWNEIYLNQFVDNWRKIARRFKGNHDVVYGYDLVNEPYQRGPVPYGYWEVQRRAAEAIREIDLDTPIVIESNGNDSAHWYCKLSPLAMDNIIYQVHMYEPMLFTHQQVFSPDQPKTVWPDESKGWNRAWLKDKFKNVVEFSKKHNAKIYVGEFSAVGWADGAEKWIADCASIVDEFGWDWTYHAFREWNGWSVEHEGSDFLKLRPAQSDTPRKIALLDALKRRGSRKGSE